MVSVAVVKDKALPFSVSEKTFWKYGYRLEDIQIKSVGLISYN
jgi:hypothetical protein